MGKTHGKGPDLRRELWECPGWDWGSRARLGGKAAPREFGIGPNSLIFSWSIPNFLPGFGAEEPGELLPLGILKRNSRAPSLALGAELDFRPGLAEPSSTTRPGSLWSPRTCLIQGKIGIFPEFCPNRPGMRLEFRVGERWSCREQPGIPDWGRSQSPGTETDPGISKELMGFISGNSCTSKLSRIRLFPDHSMAFSHHSMAFSRHFSHLQLPSGIFLPFSRAVFGSQSPSPARLNPGIPGGNPGIVNPCLGRPLGWSRAGGSQEFFLLSLGKKGSRDEPLPKSAPG